MVRDNRLLKPFTLLTLKGGLRIKPDTVPVLRSYFLGMFCNGFFVAGVGAWKESYNVLSSLNMTSCFHLCIMYAKNILHVLLDFLLTKLVKVP